MDEITNKIIDESNLIIKKGSFYTVIIAFCSSIILFIFYFTLKPTDMLYGVALWSLSISFFSLCIYLLAHFSRITGFKRYIIAVTFVSFPLTLFIAAYFLRGNAAVASYLIGPPVISFYVFTVMTAFFYNPKISIFTSVVAFLEYLLLYFVSKPVLEELVVSDPEIQNTLQFFPAYMFKGIFIIIIGLLVGLISTHSKNIIINFINEKKNKDKLSRLFGEYVSNEIRDQIVNLEKSGELKKMVILFSDIRNFSQFSEQNQPDLVVKYLNDYFDRMVHCITKHGGIIDKFIGDAIMGTFGGLSNLQNPCDSALLAALEMQEELKKLNESWGNNIIFANGIGLDYGEVLQGVIGSMTRKEFTVIGDTVNTASRIEGLTKKYGTILFSDKFYQGLSSKYQQSAYKLGSALVKGKKQEITIYRLKSFK